MLKMKIKLLNILLLLVLVFNNACSSKKLENLGFIKKKPNQYAVSRKAPLEMPPDMYLAPPETEVKNRNQSSPILKNEENLDDILANKSTLVTKNNNQSLSKKKRILRNILNTKAVKILK
ncbi:MAG: hypothetical protein CMP36_02485 [Rickettsiales bacterium]|nr:hypothetical protein [Rickettsiales bacterium]OUV80535.1 MAG: hypothetical protein CBC91_03100 [Rickettsiales bacterium TMED131]